MMRFFSKFFHRSKEEPSLPLEDEYRLSEIPERSEATPAPGEGATAIKVDEGQSSGRRLDSRNKIEICGHCGAQGTFRRYDNEGPVCDDCSRKIALEVIMNAFRDEGTKSAKILGPGGRQVWPLPCPICGNIYIVGVNASIAAMGDLLSLFSGALIIGGVPPSQPALVGSTGNSYTPPPSILTEVQWHTHEFATRNVRIEIAQGKAKAWYCQKCGNSKSPTEYPPVPSFDYAEDDPHRASEESSPSKEESTENLRTANPSEFLPDFPLHPMYDFVKGAPISRERLANVIAVVSCLCQAFETWKTELGRADWPSYADGELKAFLNILAKMKAKVPSGVSHSVDTNEVRVLAGSYLRQIREDSRAFNEFQGKHLTLLGLTIDFCNTIGYGGVVQGALNWYE